jgi:2,6-dihydroxypseudooxynicotine hydrolase
VAAIGGPYNFGDCWPILPSLTRAAFQHHSGARGEDEARERAGRFGLEGVLGRLAAPLLVVFGRRDRIVPWQRAERVAAEAPSAELVMYPDAGHVCNDIPYRYRPLVGDWMSERLSGGGQPR